MADRLPIVVDGVLREDGRVDVLALGGGLNTGEGLFETLPVVAQRPHFFDRHVARITEGARELGLLPAPTPEVWRADLDRLGRAAPTLDLAVRLLLFRDGERVRRIVAGNALDLGPQAPARIDRAAPGLDGPRPLAHLKTLNYLGPRRAHAEGRTRGLDEVLFVLDDGRVLEGSRSTVFLVRDGVLHTPPLTLPILPGVTRAVLLEEARGAGIPVTERGFTLPELQEADEVFLSASLRGVRPVASVCGTALPARPGPLTLRIRGLYVRRVAAAGGEPQNGVDTSRRASP